MDLRFLEVTLKKDDKKMLIPLIDIISVSGENDGTTFIQLGCTDDLNDQVGLIVKESYQQIKLALLKAVLLV